MKLIAKEKDYWDFKLKEWVDDNKNVPCWVRKKEELQVSLIKNELSKRLDCLSSIKDYILYKDNERSYFISINLYIIIFCGYSYPLIEITYYNEVHNSIISKNTTVTLKNYFFYKKEFINSYDYKILYNEVEKNIEVKIFKHYLSKRLIKFLDSGILNSLNLATGVYDFKKNVLFKDILLKDYAFYNIKDAESAYKELETYINYTCSRDNNLVTLPDNVILKKRGFNEKSFKNR